MIQVCILLQREDMIGKQEEKARKIAVIKKNYATLKLYNLNKTLNIYPSRLTKHFLKVPVSSRTIFFRRRIV